MPAFLARLAISGISALAGLFGNRQKQQQQQSRSVQDINQLNMPEYDSKQMQMRNMLMDMYLGRAEDTGDFFSGYRNQGLNTINQGASSADSAIQNILASRGLGSTTAGASSLVQNQLNRLNQQNTLLNQIPLLADERQRNNLADAGGFFSRLPTGQRTTGQNVTNTTGNVTIPGNQLGGTFASLGTTLAGLYGEGAFGGGRQRYPFDEKMIPTYANYNNPNNFMNYQPKKIDFGF